MESDPREFDGVISLADATEFALVMQRSALWWVALAVVLVVLAGVVAWLRTRFRDDSGPAANGDEMLRLAGDLHRRGDLSDDEYRSLKGRLLEREARETDARTESTGEGEPPFPAGTVKD